MRGKEREVCEVVRQDREGKRRKALGTFMKSGRKEERELCMHLYTGDGRNVNDELRDAREL